MPGWIRRAVVGMAVALVLAGCAAAVSPSPSAPASPALAPTVVPSPQASASPGVSVPSSPSAAACVNPPPDIAVLADQADPVACYGNGPLTVDAHLVGPAQVDYVVMVAPAWLGEPSTYLEVIGETSKNGPFLLAAVDPATAASVSKHLDSNVRIAGHFDDPAAQICRETGRVPGMGTPEPAAGAIEHCRRTFVITDVVTLGP